MPESQIQPPNPLPAQPIKLYRFPLSGHSHRAELFIRLLDLPHTLIDVDLVQGAQRLPAFLRLNRFAQVPVIDDAGTVVADSNAILTYLVDSGAPWLASAGLPTIADIAMYTYTAHAPEGGVSLDAYPALRDWLLRVEALPRFQPMPVSAVGLRSGA